MQSTDKRYVAALPGQALIDLAMQEAGTIEALFDLAKINGGMGVTDDLIVGHLYVKPSVLNTKIVIVFSGKHKPASDTTISFTTFPELLDGIDYWIVEDDFVVS